MEEINPYKNSQAIHYNDIYLRLIACLLASHLIVAYGESLSTFEIIMTPEYYYAMLPSFFIAFILFSIIRGINIHLDRRFDWKAHALQRIGLQVFFGVVLPAICAFLLAAGYFTIRGINIFKTTYLKYDYEFILLQLFLINLYYLAYYFYARWLAAEKAISSMVKEHKQSITGEKETFLVSKGAKSIIVPLNETAYFFRDGDSNYLRPSHGQDYFVNQSLDEIQEQLPQDSFFRINRQLLANRKSIAGYDLLLYGKLEARLAVPVEIPTVISQKRARDFKKWLEQ